MRSLRAAALLAALVVSTALADAQPAPTGPLAQGLTSLERTDYAAAEKQLSSVKGADEPQAKVALSRVMLETGRFDDADRYAQAAIASASTRVAGTVAKARVLAARGRSADAIKLLTGVKTTKGADGRAARLLLGELLIESGKRDDADEPLKAIIEEYNDGGITAQDAAGLASVGRAAYLLRSPKDANQAFMESERVDKKRVETLLWRAGLFLEKYDPGHAEETAREALELAPKLAHAYVLMARVKLEQTLDFDEAERLVKKALEVNPKLPDAFAVRAGLALRDMDLAGADKAIAEGLATNPNHLELLSLRAATRFLDDDKPGFEAAKAEVFKRNAQYARFYDVVSEYAEWEHRYDDIVAMMKEATKLDPDDGKAWAQLGLTQMRSGDEDAGLEALQKAWRKDKFNVRVFNTLNLYEKQIATQYETVPDGVFKFRYAKDEKPILERYVPRLMGEAFASMKARYAYVPSVPVQIELYGSREQFSVRTGGLPNIGIQGVCFGRVVAAISPKAEPANWGQVLWHELGHVFAIQMSKNHVPRWFTEGLSEYETIARRPEWSRELDAELYLALQRKTLPGAVDMNRAFTHASDAGDMTVAYYASSQMLVWTVERFGMGKVVAALKLWGQGKKTPDVIRGAFGLSPADYDAQFRAWMLQRLSRYKGQYIFAPKPKSLDAAKAAVAASPKDAGAQVDLALASIRARKGDDAKAALAAALALDPKNADALFVSAKMAIGQSKAADAVKHLDTMRANGHDGYQVRMLLADLADEQKDKAGSRLHLESAWRLDPSQAEALKGLVDLAVAEKRDDDALDALRKLAPLEQHDRKVWAMLLERLIDRKLWEEARTVGEAAVYVDVTGGAAHMGYARALSALGAHDKAAFEAETASLCKMEKKDVAAAHVLAASSLLALKKNKEAAAHRDEALRIAPDDAAAKALKIP
jgi:cellulose synthase operon protein C